MSKGRWGDGKKEREKSEMYKIVLVGSGRWVLYFDDTAAAEIYTE